MTSPGRPAHPTITPEEAEATKGTGARRAAWEISAMRGGATHPERRVSHTWVIGQRKRRNETPGGTKSGFDLLRTLKAKAEENSDRRAIRDPVRPQEDTEMSGVVAGANGQEAASSIGKEEVAAGGKA